ncbi:protein-glutamate O-methyltransferase CheR [bacterium]|nr:protein-glutamate O-methyltransferase CheR [bacterium]
MTNTLKEILAEVKAHTGLNFAQYQREVVVGRIADRMAALGCPATEDYWERLRGNRQESNLLAESIFINVTRFFRNPIVFEILAQRIFPALLGSKRAAGSRELRIWSAGCASGEEPYSVAILLKEILQFDPQLWTTHIFATDLDEGALAEAEAGVYPEDRLDDTKMGLVRKYFRAQGDTFEVLPEIRGMVRFSRDDVTSLEMGAPADSVFGGFDLIFFRNVLIYLNKDLQRSVCEKLEHALNDGGYLILGAAEGLPRGLTGRFTALDSANRIYRKNV